MKRKGHLSPLIETEANFEAAFQGYSSAKHGRPAVRKFENDLEGNLRGLLEAYHDGSWHTSAYE